MGNQVYRESYVAALEVAHSQLEQIFQDYDQLQFRKEQLEQVLGALEPFFRSTQSVIPEARQAEAAREKTVKAAIEREVAKPQSRAVPTPEPVTPTVFSPLPEDVLDPLQSRINRALGLAVA